MKSKKTKPKNAPKVETFTPAQVGALIERLEGQFKLFGEKLDSLGDKLDSTNGMVARNKEDVTMINLNVSGIKHDITKINGKMAIMENDIRVMKTDITEIKDNVKTHNTRLTRVEVK
ncbi:MAG: hypothetical protein ABIB11_04340 [Candidatus Omnitrophota bacterium]